MIALAYLFRVRVAAQESPIDRKDTCRVIRYISIEIPKDGELVLSGVGGSFGSQNSQTTSEIEQEDADKHNTQSPQLDIEKAIYELHRSTSGGT
ncbi:hypothetical protein VNO78_23152 [Psophocarpus tetragonolobus]|uniref:Uncharacterized protein n=1 Tax=Psophocarpus tetragonolobus TaxID=3891 RepID=A0AAN9S398_PSOTE